MNLIHAISNGGFFTYVILITGAVVILIGIERYISISIRYALDGRKFFNELKRFLADGDFDRAKEFCAQYPEKPLAQVMSAGIAQVSRGEKHVDLAIESETLHCIPLINKRLNYLAGLANLSTLLGLTGTITGLISSFAALGGQSGGGASKAEALSAGIAESMYTTAFGLFVAVPAVLIHMFLSSRAHHLIQDIDSYASKLKKYIGLLLSESTPQKSTENSEALEQATKKASLMEAQARQAMELARAKDRELEAYRRAAAKVQPAAPQQNSVAEEESEDTRNTANSARSVRAATQGSSR